MQKTQHYNAGSADWTHLVQLPLSNTSLHSSSLAPLASSKEDELIWSRMRSSLMHFILFIFIWTAGFLLFQDPWKKCILHGCEHLKKNKNTGCLGSLGLTPGQVSSSASRLPPVSCLSLLFLSAPQTWNELETTALCLVMNLRNPDTWALETADMEWCLLTETTLNHLERIPFFCLFVSSSDTKRNTFAWVAHRVQWNGPPTNLECNTLIWRPQISLFQIVRVFAK